MSFRYYLGQISKKKREKIKDYSEEQILKLVKNEFFFPDMIVKELFELGSDFNISKKLEAKLTPFFSEESQENICNDCFTLFILDKEGLKQIIDDIHEEIHNHFLKLQKNIELLIKGEISYYEADKLKRLIKSKTDEWGDKKKYNYCPYNLDLSQDLINSCKYEYAIFELVLIYRIFDFEKNELVFFGN